MRPLLQVDLSSAHPHPPPLQEEPPTHTHQPGVKGDLHPRLLPPSLCGPAQSWSRVSKAGHVGSLSGCAAAAAATRPPRPAGRRLMRRWGKEKSETEIQRSHCVVGALGTTRERRSSFLLHVCCVTADSHRRPRQPAECDF